MNTNVDVVKHRFFVLEYSYKRSFLILIQKGESGQGTWQLTKALRHMAEKCKPMAIFAFMYKGLLKSVIWRNLVGALALVIAYYIPDRYWIETRAGLDKFLPYLFLLLMYAWIVFHNRLLFEGLYLNNRITFCGL